MQWQKNMQLIDANVILRYLLNDHEEMSMKAKKFNIIRNGIYKTRSDCRSCLCIERCLQY